jgi:hypothetical protein
MNMPMAPTLPQRRATGALFDPSVRRRALLRSPFELSALARRFIIG